MKKIGIVTVFTGYNYGSLLQAYSMQQVLRKLGYQPRLLWDKEGLVKGRDIRIKKILVMAFRALIQPKAFRESIASYKSANNQRVLNESKKKFDEFTDKYLKIERYSYRNLKKIGISQEFHAFVCGSDQIWNSKAIYVDPLYYLKFAPNNKKIAYAPSFGKDEIPEYNRKKIKSYLQSIKYLSIREEKGKEIIKDLINKEVPVLIDPTLLLDGQYWSSLSKSLNSEPYVLFYFLSEPSIETIEILREIETYFNKKVVVLPSIADWHNEFQRVETMPTGPIEFISLIKNADFVCTDSFHGMSFSVNFNIPFLVFKRNYGKASNQSSRISSLLSILGLEDRYVKNDVLNLEKIDIVEFNQANCILKNERNKSILYLKSALKDCY
ncbi:MAG: polysaccharide pyruvyl transferase family protein [Epulopiscium sp.]|nr:polysaccharide pyruvyl transferase family protein [Candidatus Epulonipiscium sp.]